MWLPNDERCLLRGYYAQLHDVDVERWFSAESWFPVLDGKETTGKIPEYGHEVEPKGPSVIAQETKEYLNKARRIYQNKASRIEVANNILSQRGFIKFSKHETVDSVFGVSLTIDGYDLGRRYSSWFERSGLWFREYREHWIWLIVAFAGGIIGAVLLDCLKVLFK